MKYLTTIINIILLWTGVVAIAVGLAFLYEGKYLFIRCIFIAPFAISAMFGTTTLLRDWKK